MSTLPVPHPTMRRIVEVATRAPSVHNTQPWRWRATDRALELHADRTRQLSASDPCGRNLVISCGAALHHAQVVAEALGWSGDVRRHPDPAAPDLLARLDLLPAPPSTTLAQARAQAILETVLERRTDRRRFTAWPVPEERVSHLASRATAQGAMAVPLVDVSDRFRAERLVDRAAELSRQLKPLAQEQESWVDHSAVDGVPASTLSGLGRLPPARSSRLTETLDNIGGGDLEGSDGLVLLLGADDGPEAWLRAGEGLSALWLAATRDGLSVVPLSQVLEVDETRETFRREVLRGMAHPLLLVRIGWQAMGRGLLERTPRRPVDDVLTFVQPDDPPT